MKPQTIALCAIVLATSSVAQARVIPSAAATKDPGYYDYFATYGTTSTSVNNEGHAQYLFDSADVGKPAVWKQINARRPTFISNTNAATTFNMTIIMSNSPVQHDQGVATWTANHGSKSGGTLPVTVFNGKISLPANTRGTWPPPWFPVAVFTTVFVHAPVKGGSLVIEMLGSNNSNKRIYYREGFRPDTGQRVSNGPSGGCQWHSGGTNAWNSGISYRLPVVGGQWYVQHNSMPHNEPNMKQSLCLIGNQGIGGKYLGKTLPIPITQFGFNDICKKRPGVLANNVLAYFPMTYQTSTSVNRGSIRTPTFNIPNDPKLAGVFFFQQPISMDKGVNNVYMGWPSKWIIGSGKGLPGSTIYRTGNNAATTGFLRDNYGPTFQLN